DGADASPGGPKRNASGRRSTFTLAETPGRGGRVAEGTRLLSEYGVHAPSRVRIPPSPLQRPRRSWEETDTMQLGSTRRRGYVRALRSRPLLCSANRAIAAVQDIKSIERTELKADRVEVFP